MRALRRALVIVVACALTHGATTLGDAHANGRRIPGPLFGGAEPGPRVEIPVDPELPRGARITARPRPELEHTSCSPRRPVCLHASEFPPEDSLVLLEDAYDRLVLALELPPPLPDGLRGGSPALDVYLKPERNTSTAAQLVVSADPARLVEDSASAFCELDAAHLDPHTATRCLAEAIALRLDAAESPALREAYGSSLAAWLTGPDDDLLDALARSQQNPQIGVIARDPTPLTRAAASWFAFLDAEFGASRPGELATTMFALSRSLTRDPHPEWHNEPDLLDVLRRSLEGDPRRVADSFGKFALARLTWATASRAPIAGWLVSTPALHFDWTFPYSSLPRRVASARAVEPLGVSAVQLELDSVPLGARLGLRIEWEAPVSFRWYALGLDLDGRELRRWDFPYLERGRVLEHTLMDFENAHALVFVGTNLGGVDLSHPFDPDREPWEPHAYTLYLTELPRDTQ